MNSFLTPRSANFAFRMKQLDGSRLFILKNMLLLIDIVVIFELRVKAKRSVLNDGLSQATQILLHLSILG